MSAPTMLDATDNRLGRLPAAAPGPPSCGHELGGVLPATRKVLLAFAVLTLLATNQLMVVAGFTDRYFAWTISVRPPRRFSAPRTPRASCSPSSPCGGVDGEMSGWRWSPSPCSPC